MADCDATKPSFVFLWKIEQFSYCLQEHGYKIVSPRFVVEALESNVLKFELIMMTDSISIRLDRVPLIKNRYYQWDFSLVTASGPILKSFHTSDWRRLDTSYCPTTLKKCEIFGKKKDSLLPQDTLTVRFRIWSRNFNKPASESFARTQLVVHRKNFTWKIENFSALHTQKKIVDISTVLMAVKLYESVASTCKRKALIEIVQENSSTSNFVTCEISLLNSRREVCAFSSDEYSFQKGTEVQTWKFTMPLVKLYLENDSFSVRCGFAVSEGFYSSEIDDILPVPDNDTILYNQKLKSHTHSSSEATVCPLKEGLHSLYEEQKFCDVTLQSGSAEFGAHRAVLCAMSPVFFAMFDRDMKERREGNVVIKDIKEDTLKRMLVFLYTHDLVEDMELEGALDLYFAADKYEIALLRKRCSSVLLANLTAFNACEVLILADKHRDEELATRVTDFVLRNCNQILGTDNWLILEQTHPLLAIQVFREICSKKLNLCKSADETLYLK